MKSILLHRKPVSLFVIIAFTVMMCYWANQAPAAPAVPGPEKGSAASMGSDEGESPGFIEQEESTPAYKKGKKFPWLIVGLVVVAGGAALYFLVLKKKNYTLTTTVGEGVTGVPAAGAVTYKKGETVSYNYSLQGGYSDLAVTLDGAPIAASGTITMNANHTLAANATKTFILTVTKGEHVNGTPAAGSYTYARGTNVAYSYAPASGYSNLEVKLDNVIVANSGTVSMDNNHTLSATLFGANIEVNSTPAGARIYLDKVDSGQTTPYTFNFPTAVTKAVHLRPTCGFKEYRETVSVALGQTKTINHTLIPGIWEEFVIPASSCWHPYEPSRWSMYLDGGYRYLGSPSQWDWNSYYYAFSGNYSVAVHMNRKSGNNWAANSIFLGTGLSMTSANGYSFQYQGTGNYSIYRNTNYNFVNNTGTSAALRSWTSSPAIYTGLSHFNVLRVVKSGINYDFYINGTHVTTVSDATFNPTYVHLLFYVGGASTEIKYNYVKLDLGGAVAGSQPCPASTAAPMNSEAKDQTGGSARKE